VGPGRLRQRGRGATLVLLPPRPSPPRRYDGPPRLVLDVAPRGRAAAQGVQVFQGPPQGPVRAARALGAVVFGRAARGVPVCGVPLLLRLLPGPVGSPPRPAILQTGGSASIVSQQVPARGPPGTAPRYGAHPWSILCGSFISMGYIVSLKASVSRRHLFKVHYTRIN